MIIGKVYFIQFYRRLLTSVPCTGIIMEIHINITIVLSLRNSGTWSRRLFLAAGEKSVYMYICRVQHLAILPKVFLFFFLHSCKFWVGLQFQNFLGTLMQPFRFKYISIKPLTLKITKLLFYQVSPLALTSNSKFPDPCLKKLLYTILTSIYFSFIAIGRTIGCRVGIQQSDPLFYNQN